MFVIKCSDENISVLRRILLQLHSTDRFFGAFCILDSEFFFYGESNEQYIYKHFRQFFSRRRIACGTGFVYPQNIHASGGRDRDLYLNGSLSRNVGRRSVDC